MAIKFKKFTSRGGNDIRAIKLTERNIDNVEEWLSKKLGALEGFQAEFVTKLLDGPSYKLRVRLPKKGWRVVRPGDYVCWDTEDRAVPFVFKAADFEEKYKELK